MIEIKAPQEYKLERCTEYIFLAGSIEEGKAEQWQDKVIAQFADIPGIAFLNPRRDSWSNNIDLEAQIKWELDGLMNADIVLMYIDPTTKSPITLLELGLLADDANLFVCCAPEFYRYTNVKVTCEFFEVPLVHSLEELIELLADVI